MFVLVGAGVGDCFAVPSEARPLLKLPCLFTEERLMHHHRIFLRLFAHGFGEGGVFAVLLAADGYALSLTDVESLLHSHLLDNIVNIHLVNLAQIAAYTIGVALVHAKTIDVRRKLGFRIIEGVCSVVYFLCQIGVFAVAGYCLEACQSRTVEGHTAYSRSGDYDVHIVVAYDGGLECGEGYLLYPLLLRRNPYHSGIAYTGRVGGTAALIDIAGARLGCLYIRRCVGEFVHIALASTDSGYYGAVLSYLRTFFQCGEYHIIGSLS